MDALAVGHALRQPALLAHGAHQRDQFDHHQRGCEHAQRFRPVEAARDEQEGQARQQAQQEPEEVLPSALGEGGHVFVGLSGCHPALPCSALSGRARMPDTVVRGSSPLMRP